MNNMILRRVFATAWLLAFPLVAQPQTAVVNEDIDLYLAGGSSSCSTGSVNVLLILDNASYWANTYTPFTCSDGSTTYVASKCTLQASTTKMATEKAALHQVVSALGANFNVGLMMATSTSGSPSNGSVPGGYLRFAMRPMTSANKAALLQIIDNLSQTNDQASPNSQYARSMHEAYLYFGGKPLFNSTQFTCTGTGLSSSSICGANPSPFYPPYPGGPSLNFLAAGSNVGGQYKADNGVVKHTCTAQNTCSTVNLGDTGAFSAAVRQATDAAYNTTTNKPPTYKSPITDPGQKNYIILISNGITDMNENGNSGGSPTSWNAHDLLVFDGGNTAEITLGSPYTGGTNGIQGSYVDQYARFLYGTDVRPDLAGQQNIVTYVVNPWPTNPGNQDNDMETLMQSVANQGKGKYFRASDVNSLALSLTNIFQEVAAVNSVFAAATLPVSATVRGTNLNQVYLGMFRPDANFKPRWFGNLKMYQVGYNSGTKSLFLADATGAAADSASTGFLTPGAASFWTTTSNFWGYRAAAMNGQGLASDLPDGEIVEKGATAENLRITYAASQSTRNLYTCTGACTGGSALSATPFATSNTALTPAALGVTPTTDTTTANNIVNWVRGQDNLDENANSVSTDVRPSIHGDVLHSRPAVINYNRNSPSDNNDVFIFYGGNDGVLHAVQGGNGTNAGQEAWGFVAPEFFGQLGTLRNNSPVIGSTAKKPYFFDGSVGFYALDANHDGKLDPAGSSGDKVYLYLTARRGGRLIYALDITSPLAPKFLWKATPTQICNSSGCTATTAYAELGQTWSTVKIARIRASANPVAIFGGGYDSAAQDQDPNPGTDSVGRAIFVADATTGALLWQSGPNPPASTTPLVGTVKTVAGMTSSIPSDITVYDSDGDGYADRLYVGDSGGNVWRVDIGDPAPANWVVNPLASIAGSGATRNRKFQFAPDVVFRNDSSGQYDAVLIGSGDREHPFNTQAVNRYYMFKDYVHGKLPMTVGSTTVTTINPNLTGNRAINEGDLYDATSDLVQVGTAAQQGVAAASIAAANGWFITLASGEKVVSGSTSIAGTTQFNTYQPTSSSSCSSDLGQARSYYVNYMNAAATISLTAGTAMGVADRSRTVAGGGFLPTPVPVAMQFGNNLVYGTMSGTQVTTFPAAIGARTRIYWRNKSE